MDRSWTVVGSPGPQPGGGVRVDADNQISMYETTAAALEAQADTMDRNAAELRRLAIQLRTSDVKAAAPGLLSIREAVVYAGLSEWAVRQLLAAGQITEVRIGRRRLISRDSLDALTGQQAAS